MESKSFQGERVFSLSLSLFSDPDLGDDSRGIGSEEGREKVAEMCSCLGITILVCEKSFVDLS